MATPREFQDTAIAFPGAAISSADAAECSAVGLPSPRDGVRLVTAFTHIEDAEVRRALIVLAEALARPRH
jgi:hypothetical protein